MVKTYRLGPGGFRPLQTQLILKAILMTGLAVGAGLFIVSRRTNLEGRQLAVILPMLVLFVGFGLYRSLARERASLLGSEWDIDDDLVRRRTPHRPVVEIRRDEVTRIEAIQNGLVVRGRTAAQAIWIPAWLEDIASLRARLTTWQVIEPQVRRVSASTLNIAVSIAVILAFATAFVSGDSRVVVPLSLLLAGGLVYSLWFIRRSVHLDSRVKRGAWFVLLPVLALLARALSMLGR